jgi:tetratricopeptide (TPR) repeat protein
VARGGFNEADLAVGMRHARAAIIHGADDPTALAIASVVLLHLGRDFPAASNAVTRALEINGSCAIAYFFGAHINAFCGDIATARDYARRGLHLSPFDELALAGRIDEAKATAKRLLELEPNFSSAAIIGFLSFVRPELTEAWTTGLRAAGLPE